MAAAAGTVRVWGAGLGVVVLWASAFPAIRVASPELGVIGLSFVRLAIAAFALLAAAPVFGVRRPARRDLPLILACGLTGMTAYQLLLNQGELSVPAGTASILVASGMLCPWSEHEDDGERRRRGHRPWRTTHASTPGR